MDRKELDAILLLAGLSTDSIWETVNGYSKSREDPWYLIQTKWGMIHMGWRKRVINIDWAQTPIRVVVTEEDLTKDETHVHAYSMAKAAQYLRTWRMFAERQDAYARRDAELGETVDAAQARLTAAGFPTT